VLPEKRSVGRKWHSKHVKAVKNNHITTDDLLEAVFSMRSALTIYKENQLESSVGGFE
jgi:hypothetical protein